MTMKEPLRTHRNFNPCPWCGRPNDAHTEADPGRSKPPAPGDVGVCWGCHRCMVFGDDGALRRPTPVEQAEFDADPRIQEVLAVMRSRTDLGPTLAAAEARRRLS